MGRAFVLATSVGLLVACGGDDFVSGGSGGGSATGGVGATGGGAGSGGSGAQGGSGSGGAAGSSGGGGGSAGGGNAGNGGSGATGGSAGAPPKIVFVTAESYPGNFAEGHPSAIARAADLCKLSAQESGELGGKNWHPWISTGLTPASAGLKGVSGPWQRTDGQPVFESVAAISSGPPQNPINRDAKATQLSGLVWTGTPYGTGTAGTHCAAWSSTALFGIAGKMDATDKTWTDHSYGNCGANYRLYCFEK